VSLDSRRDSPATRWGEHYIHCPYCYIGALPADDVFCSVGRPLRQAAIDDMLERASRVPLGEVSP
jgi:hypothetical protein